MPSSEVSSFNTSLANRTLFSSLTVFDKVRPVAAVAGYVTARSHGRSGGPVKDWWFHSGICCDPPGNGSLALLMGTQCERRMPACIWF